jgi:hypothetical protein
LPLLRPVFLFLANLGPKISRSLIDTVFFIAWLFTFLYMMLPTAVEANLSGCSSSIRGMTGVQ